MSPRTLRVTRGGWVVSALTVVLLVGAVLLDWTAAAFLAVTAVAALAWAYVTTRRWPNVDVTVRLTPPVISRGGESVLAVTAANEQRRRSPGFTLAASLASVVVEVSVDPVRSGAVATCSSSPITLPQRGVWQLDSATVVRRDAFGLVARVRTVPTAAYVVVHPVVSFIDVGVPRHGLAAGHLGPATLADVTAGGLREYMQGDNPRHIDWRATARSPHTMTRTFEDPLAGEATVLLDTTTSSYAEDEEFEAAVDLTASICTALIEVGYAVTLVAGAMPVVESGRGDRARQRLLDRLATATRSDNAPFAEMLRTYHVASLAYAVTGTTEPARGCATAAARRWPGVRIWTPTAAGETG